MSLPFSTSLASRTATNTSDFDFNIGTDSVRSLFSRIDTAINTLRKQPFAEQQQAIATELLNTVFSSIVGLPAQHQSGTHKHAVPESAEAFVTVASNGKRIDNGQDGGANLLKWTRSDGKSDGRDATVVSFAFDNEFDVDGISTNAAKSLFIQALQTWARHAPLDFEEVKDPGDASSVDILIQSNSIDGSGGTLAFAYFPSVGDITFDSDEDWSQDTFLETAVHELGHSLGLDHEDDTDAILNSTLGNRFKNGQSFLFEDDIAGIQSLYGSGKGSVKRLGNDSPVTPTPNVNQPQPSNNIITNGSFEDVPLSMGESGKYSQINGWKTISGKGFQIDRRPNSSGKAADGTAWAELDTLNENSTIGQNIDTVTGQRYDVSVDFSDGGRPEKTTSIHVFWEGRHVDTLSGGGKGKWRRFNYSLTGGDRDVSTLAFRAIGPSDNVGGFIDNIVVKAAKENLVAARSAKLKVGLGASTDTNSALDVITADYSSPLVDTSLVLPSPTEQIAAQAFV